MYFTVIDDFIIFDYQHKIPGMCCVKEILIFSSVTVKFEIIMKYFLARTRFSAPPELSAMRPSVVMYCNKTLLKFCKFYALKLKSF